MVEQPNEATTQAEVDRPAVRYDTIMALQEKGFDNKWFIIEAEFFHCGPVRLGIENRYYVYLRLLSWGTYYISPKILCYSDYKWCSI